MCCGHEYFSGLEMCVLVENGILHVSFEAHGIRKWWINGNPLVDISVQQKWHCIFRQDFSKDKHQQQKNLFIFQVEFSSLSFFIILTEGACILIVRLKFFVKYSNARKTNADQFQHTKSTIQIASNNISLGRCL